MAEPFVDTSPKQRLVVLAGPDAGRGIALAPGRYQVGRDNDCQLVLHDATVAGRHLEIELTQNQICVRDLGSTSGSYFGGARFSEITVDDAVVVHVGGTELAVLPEESQSGILPSCETRFHGVLGRSLVMRNIYAVLERASASDVSILIEGETGTGKELLAEAIHAESARTKGAFVVCDLAGVSRTLIESELYGHLRGAFTGADRDRTGAFEQAHGGTIFIDELGELEQEAQPRLLRAIERRQVKPVGSAGYKDIDVRVVAASGRDLNQEVRAGRFREDLYHRIAVVRVVLPPLRERREDIPLLVRAFLGERAELSPGAMAALVRHDWPGNVRELRNVIERALSLATPEQSIIEAPLLGLPAPTRRASAAAGAGYKETKERLLQEWEKNYIEDLLRQSGGNVSKAAREGGLDRVYLHRLMKKHGI
jgi:DNA-binding NtrC family response regulator